MRLIIAALCIVAVAARVAPLKESQYQAQFVEFVNMFSKNYATSEIFSKYQTFKYWVDFVAEHNAKNLSWTAGINEFSDMMPEEFAAVYLMKDMKVPHIEATPVDVSDVANDVDWRQKGAVNPVKNQGSCGSCWAFSTTGVLEGYAKIYNNELPNVSEQQLVDCSKNGQTLFGCQGGWPWAAAQWAQSKNGLCSQTAYPYTARDGACKSGCESVKSTAIKGVVQQKGEDQLLKGVDGQPVSICLDAMGGFQSYRSGIFDGPCGTQMNHAVLAVGYTADAWIVKNSWGTSWGDKGYIQMRRGKNLCGLSNVLMWGSNQ
jgi:C1A family cysteine protease